MIENFERCFQWILEHEGGFTDDTALGDTGGMTTWGITHYDWKRWTGKQPTRSEMKAIKKEDVRPVYKTFYWDVLKCDEIPSGLDYALFDYGVNSGNFRAAKTIQKIIGVTPDGEIGQETLNAILKCNIQRTALEICDQRLAFLRGLKIFKNFGRGWTRRVNEVRQRVLEMTS